MTTMSDGTNMMKRSPRGSDEYIVADQEEDIIPEQKEDENDAIKKRKKK